MPLVDLSHPITTGMQVYPGDPKVEVLPALTVARDGVAVAQLRLGSHTGTHMDAPAHTVEGGATITDIPLEWCFGEALVLSVEPEARTARLIEEGDLRDPLPTTLPRIIAVATGWCSRFGTDAALTHPSLSTALAETLWARGARVLGVDTLSPDPTECPGGAGGFPVHDLWLGRGGVIVENLRGLDELPARCELSLLPLKLHAGDGAPVRAIARFPTTQGLPPAPRAAEHPNATDFAQNSPNQP